MQPRCVLRRRGLILIGATVLAAALAACGVTPAATSTDPSTGSAAHGAAGDSTVWLCRPGAAKDPCATPLSATVVPAHGVRRVVSARDAKRTPYDCFYVYPTVSTENADNSNLAVQPAEKSVAVDQASPFSAVCRVWSPMYRQRTLRSLIDAPIGEARPNQVAYESLLSAWRDYLAHDNHGRPVIFIGHSQGAAMLIRLIASQVDPVAALRARMVVAILAGGNVTVPIGRSVGGAFHHLPLCTSSGDHGCVIAFSSFPSQPSADSVFGRPGQGVSLQWGQAATTGLQVACTNPAALGGGTAGLDPYFVAGASAPAVHTLWVTYPALYSAHCEHAGGASWLEVRTVDAAGRPTVSESLGPAWGYHADDINLTLGNLVKDVAAAERAYAARRGG